ncbi:MAG: type II toxin-antitoxin system RelE/ParE family toxin [Comamonadaceae bacterium]|nr:type II toxin-antitoxin system RelE/ParE family toxin [Comamonadaceae bacterium]
MQLEFAPLALCDLEAIGDYIAKDSPGNALRFIQTLRRQCQKICLAPLAYVARPELDEGLRSCAHGRYVIFFRPTADLVRIERILHSAMDLTVQFNPDIDGQGH